MSYGASAGAVCCCNCGAQSCCCPCLYVPYSYTATGSLDYSFDGSRGVECTLGNRLQITASMDLLVQTTNASYTLEVNSQTIPVPTHITWTEPFNPYSNNNISGQTTIQATGEYSAQERTNFPGGYLLVTTTYDVQWNQTSTDFIDPDGCLPFSACKSFFWEKTQDYDCDDPDICQLKIYHGEGLTVQYRQTRVGQTVVEEYDDNDVLQASETFPINDEDFYAFPWTHVVRVIGDYGDCEDTLGSHRMVSSGAESIRQSMAAAFSVLLGEGPPIADSNAVVVTSDECDGNVSPEELQYQSTTAVYSFAENENCVDSQISSRNESYSATVTVGCTFDRQNILGEQTCPTP